MARARRPSTAGPHNERLKGWAFRAFEPVRTARRGGAIRVKATYTSIHNGGLALRRRADVWA